MQLQGILLHNLRRGFALKCFSLLKAMKGIVGAEALVRKNCTKKTFMGYTGV